MNRAGGSDGPEDVDATFEEIIADLRAEGFGVEAVSDPEPERRDSRQATEADPRPESKPEPEPRRPATEDPAPAGTGWRDSGSDWDETMLGPDPAGDDDEHYVPPEPPPLPRPRKGAFVVLLFFVVGLLLLIAPQLIGLTSTLGTPLGMLALATGIALLLLRVKQGPPDGADPSNGAQV
ncbi:hypothetical protein [Prauserella endophytica]|uniref:DUF308 domain-containing protein n=1 Tax=Prauserella endophytica TaxID=1592324 RepID=A0ABY2RVY4_9PSEU|nr:hypothetical protein [Prauserella endophytica]PXY33064.1 hypothetical protein BAY59_08055 [Prauserella coralliicola]TKG62648.1 hypothetical protein FCN18_31905 [Prauserella endophytica]